MTKFTNFMLVPMAMTLGIASFACDSADSGGDDGGDETGGTAGTAGTAGSGVGGSAGSGMGGTGGSGTGAGTVLQPDSSGWMDAASTDWNDIEIQGAWYPYGDQYGVAKCTGVGMHMSAECSTITKPNPDPMVLEAMGFPPEVGTNRMCTEGVAAQILPCVGDLPARCPNCNGCPENDYSTMWGAGIGFDANSAGGSQTAPKYTWNPDEHGITWGFSFELVDAAGMPLQLPPGVGIRVEIPMELTEEEGGMFMAATTDDHPDGAPYWGATGSWPPSPVKAGKNCVPWTAINAPAMVQRYMFDRARMLGIQFHVPTNNAAPVAYSFCIQNVTMLRQDPGDCPAM